MKKPAQRTVRIHLTIKPEFATAETVKSIIDRGRLVNANENRAGFFNYQLFSADLTPTGRSIDEIRKFREVESVSIDQGKSAVK